MKTIVSLSAVLLLVALISLRQPIGSQAAIQSPSTLPIAEQTVLAANEPEDAESEDLPWVPILIISLAIPAAVLIVPSFFGKGGSGGH